MGIIYIAENKENHKRYVGQTTLSINARINLHMQRVKNQLSHSPFHTALSEFGKEGFYYYKIDDGDSKEELNYKEKYWIKALRTQEREFGYNVDKGGTGPRLTDEERLARDIRREEKHRENKKRYYEEHRSQMIEHGKAYYYANHEENKKKAREKYVSVKN